MWIKIISSQTSESCQYDMESIEVVCRGPVIAESEGSPGGPVVMDTRTSDA